MDDFIEHFSWLQDTTVAKLQPVLQAIHALQHRHPREHFVTASQEQLALLMEHVQHVDEMVKKFDEIAQLLMTLQ